MKKIILGTLILTSSIAFSSEQHKYQKAVFAGGCFWCLESDFEYMQKHNNLGNGGIIKVISGYDGDTRDNPSYKLVVSGVTDYKESVEVIYDPKKISYEKLVEYFYRRINPTDAKGQFCDRGKEYQSAIYYMNKDQKQIADQVTKKAKAVFKQKGKQVYTQILPSTHFYPAEKYHQNYHHKNPKRYCYYRTGCQRDVTVNNTWKGIDWKYSNVVPFNVPNSYAECLVR